MCVHLDAVNIGFSVSVLSGHSKRRPELVFKTDYRLMQVKGLFLSERPLKTETENPIFTASSCTHMRICVHVVRPYMYHIGEQRWLKRDCATARIQKVCV